MSAARGIQLRTRALLLAACALPVLAGCSDFSKPVRPADPGVTIQPPVVKPGFAPITRSGRIYSAAPSLDDAYTRYHGASLLSRFVLYDDSTFALQFTSAKDGLFEYDGQFTRVESRIIFTWQGWSVAGPWGAEATLQGDSLTVSYNDIMQLTDFIGGTYKASPKP